MNLWINDDSDVNPDYQAGSDSTDSSEEKFIDQGNINHLLRRLLYAPAEVRDKYDEQDDQNSIPEKAEKSWSKQNPQNIRSNPQEPVSNVLSREDNDEVDSCSTAFDFLSLSLSILSVYLSVSTYLYLCVSLWLSHSFSLSIYLSISQTYKNQSLM